MELTRKKEMTWVSYAVHQEIQNLPDLPNEEKEKVYFYVNYRIKNSFRLSRAYFTWKMYHYMMGCSIPDIQLVRIAFLAELVTCITYMQNQIYDEKNGVNNKEEKQRNYYAIQVLHDKILPAYIRNHFEPKFATRMIHCMRKGVSNFVRGVKIEKQWLNYDSLPVQQLFGEPIFTPEEEEQVGIHQYWDVYEQCKKGKEVLNSLLLKNYLKRTYLINTTLYETIVNMLIYIYANDIDPVIQNNMRDYARAFGVVQQIVNDVQDFLPVTRSKKVDKAEKFKFCTRAKRPEDTMADIRNRLITLPLIYFFQIDQSKHSIIAKYMKNDNSDINLYEADNQIEVLKILRQSGAWDKSHKLVTCFGNIAKEWLNPENPATELLADMMSITNPDHNQYLKAIIEFEFN